MWRFTRKPSFQTFCDHGLKLLLRPIFRVLVGIVIESPFGWHYKRRAVDAQEGEVFLVSIPT